MSEVKWIKLSTAMFDDEKIRLIEQMPDADTIIVIWVKLLAQAGKTNASGYIFLSENIPYTEEMLATIFNRPLATVRYALKVFQDLGMVGIDDNSFISVSNWEKHQNVEGLERIREQNRIRKQRQRDREQLKLEGHVKSRDSHATDIEEDIDIDKEKSDVDKSTESLFEEWWNLYDNKKDKKKCRTRYRTLLKKNQHEDIMEGTKRYLEHLQGLKKRGEFAPEKKYPYTFLNAESFNDEYSQHSVPSNDDSIGGIDWDKI